ncbi:STAS/SEC14 domain-containing protein [candidate division WOR-3 bacterium]|nr:STAS/SEC14 domain-containing protein [candidate division WOR-3 bacterium]
MNHEIFYDEDANAVMLRVKGKLTEADIIEMSADNERYKENYSFILDLRQATAMLDKKTRHRLKLETQGNPPSKTAIIVTNPGVRAVVNLIMKFSGKMDDTMFFENEDDALAWLEVEVKNEA